MPAWRDFEQFARRLNPVCGKLSVVVPTAVGEIAADRNEK